MTKHTENVKAQNVVGYRQQDDVLSTQETIENSIVYYLDKFCDEQNIDDMKKETQQTFEACLTYIYRNLFKGNTNIYNTQYTDSINTEYIYNNIIPSYIYICNLYNKIIDMYGIIYLLNISDIQIYTWGSMGITQNEYGYKIAKTLHHMKEKTLMSKLISEKSNSIGVLACLNHYFGWSDNSQQAQISTTQNVQSIRQKYQYQIAQTTDND